MPRELDELRRALRDEAFHLRVLTREQRNLATTRAKSYDASLQRIDRLIDELEQPQPDDHTPEEAQVNDNPARPARGRHASERAGAGAGRT